MKRLTILAALSLCLFCSCRDYLADVVDITPPEMSTDKPSYPENDTLAVTLFNRSASDIYVTGVYNMIEKQSSSNWNVFTVVMCSGGCPEFILPGKGSMTARVVSPGSGGIFRFVCYFSRKPGTLREQKSIIYSNEFTVSQ